MPTVHLIIKGKVQGVFFRASAKETAEKFTITGWVKNTLDGYVEIIATGNETEVQKFIQWCKQGPPSAQVSDLQVSEMPDIFFEKFEVIRQ